MTGSRMGRVQIFRCLDVVISVESRDPVLGDLVDDLFRDMATSDAPTVHFSVLEHAGTYVVSVDGDGVVSTVAPSFALAHLMWEINRHAIEGTSDDLLLHAAAATHESGAVVIAGPSGAGKSTLIAGVVGAGLGYLTDDVLAIDASGRARPHPKPIGLGAYAPTQFPTLAAMRSEYRRYMGEEWYVAPAMLGGDVGVAASPCTVVFSCYTPEASTSAVRLSRAEALVALAENSFNFSRLGTRGFEQLAAMLRSCDCYRLVYSNLDRAVAFVLDALAVARREAIA